MTWCRHERQQQEAEAQRLRKQKTDKEAADKAAAGWAYSCLTHTGIHTSALLYTGCVALASVDTSTAKHVHCWCPI